MNKELGTAQTDFAKEEAEQVNDPAAVRMAVAVVLVVILAFTADIWYPHLTNLVQSLFGN